jgi:molecular chaperone DnaK (HSP70)
MRYVLGIDLGAGHTAAAVSRHSGEASGAGGWSEIEVVPLGSGTSAVPSVLYVSPDGTVTVGDPEPSGKAWVVRGFGRRVGDDVPLIVGGEPYTGQALLAALAMWVVDRVDEREGGRAEQIVVSHPGGWGPHRVDLLRRGLWRAGLETVTLLPWPVVAAEGYATEVPVGSGAILAVQDLGGGESAVVRRTDVATFELLGCVAGTADADADGYPGGIEPLLDDALLGFVGDQLRLRLDELDPADVLAREQIGRLREQCAAARERLITATEAQIPVEVEPAGTRVTITRTGFEELVRPLLSTAADALRGAVRSCGLAPRELGAVVLTGAAARIPLLAKLVTAALPVRLAVGDQPELRIARGAALAAQKIAEGPVSLPAWRAGEDGGRHDGPRDEYDEYPGGYGGAELALPYDGDDEADYVDGVPAKPPPRPPVALTPLDLPRRRRPRPHLPRKS